MLYKCTVILVHFVLRIKIFVIQKLLIDAIIITEYAKLFLIKDVI